MEALVKIIVGFLLLGMSLSYLYRPALVLKINQLVREIILNDSYILHYRRRWGVPLFVLAVMFLYSGMANYRSQVGDTSVAAYNQMNEAYRAFYTKRYAEAERLCLAILQTNGQDPHAQFLLRQSRKALEQAEQGIVTSSAPAVSSPH